MTEFDAPTAALADITGDYTIDPSHSRLGFVARHAMVTKVRGQFTEFSGTAHVDTADPGQLDGRRSPSRPPASTPAPPTATATSSPPTSSTPTTTPRSPSSPPTSSATATTWAITGDLTIKGITKPVTIDFERDRLGPGPVRQRPRRLRGRHHRQPQGLGPDLERRARDRRRARLREDQARVRHLRDPQLSSAGRRLRLPGRKSSLPTPLGQPLFPDPPAA